MDAFIYSLVYLLISHLFTTSFMRSFIDPLLLQGQEALPPDPLSPKLIFGHPCLGVLLQHHLDIQVPSFTEMRFI